MAPSNIGGADGVGRITMGTNGHKRRRVFERAVAPLPAGISRVASAMGNGRVVWTVVDAKGFDVLFRHRGRTRSWPRLCGADHPEHGRLGWHYHVRQNATWAGARDPRNPRGDVQDRWTSPDFYVGPAYKGGRRQVVTTVRIPA